MANINIYSKDYIINLFNDEKALKFIKETKKFERATKHWNEDEIYYIKSNIKIDILDFYNSVKPNDVLTAVKTYLEKNTSYIEEAKKLTNSIKQGTNRRIGNVNDRDIWRFLIVDHFYNTYYDNYLFKEKAQTEIKKHISSRCFLSNTLSENKEKFGKAPVVATRKQLSDMNIKTIVYSKETERPICGIEILHNNERESFGHETYFKRMCIENNLSQLPLVFIKANKNGYIKNENFNTLNKIIDDYNAKYIKENNNKEIKKDNKIKAKEELKGENKSKIEPAITNEKSKNNNESEYFKKIFENMR